MRPRSGGRSWLILRAPSTAQSTEAGMGRKTLAYWTTFSVRPGIAECRQKRSFFPRAQAKLSLPSAKPSSQLALASIVLALIRRVVPAGIVRVNAVRLGRFRSRYQGVLYGSLDLVATRRFERVDG